MNQPRVFYFSLRLLSNVIVSQSSATAGDHQCLDYIPGGSLLGVAAAALYSRLSAEQAQQLFHTQAVRFGDALPYNGAESAWPVPLCWHQVKGESIYVPGIVEKRLDAKAVFDPSRTKLDKSRQPKQLREGHITASGQMLQAEKDYELKTAIDAASGAAAESQLFGYQSLKAGQVFAFTLTVDASVPEEQVQQLLQSLSGTIRLGRSRSAQFGQALIEPLTTPLTVTSINNPGKELRLWLLSDLALLDEYGNALLQPTAAALGLPEGSEWEVKKSFIRTRSYTPFNAKRRSYDLQRQVISRGSVLVFTLPRELNPEELQRLQFIGQHQTAGLGHVAVNPALLASATPVFASAEKVASVAVKAEPIAMPNSLLLRALQQKAGASDENSQIEKLAGSLRRKINQALQSAANWAGLPENHYQGEISRSHWGQVRAMALAYSRNHAALMNTLFEDKHAVIRERDGQEIWSLPVSSTEKLANKIKQAVQDIPAHQRGQVLAHACTALMSNKSLNHTAQGERA